MQIIAGIPAAPGIAIGPGHHYRPGRAEPRRAQVEDTAAEVGRLEAAVARAEGELAAVYADARGSVGDEAAAIFEAQRMMLLDPDLLEMAGTLIRAERVNAEAAFYAAAEGYAKVLEGLADEYLRARAADVRDVAQRVIRVLSGEAGEPAALPGPAIVFADDLAPSDTVRFERGKLLGFFTALGGATSHTAILARALGIPAVVGAGRLPEDGPSEGTFILDGSEGRLFADPDRATLARYRGRRQAGEAADAEERAAAAAPAITRDGRRVEVFANIGNLADAQGAAANGAEGVGLFRTEFSYLERTALPDEAELAAGYEPIFAVFGERPVIVRTLDIGGDKELPYLGLHRETNPFLGRRGIRLCLARPDLFKPQLRAILRAGRAADLHIMFPMISTLEEVGAARAVLDECRAELEREGAGFNRTPKIGIMIEVPAAALCADRLAREVDFFSIGTNDLAQYTLAADRMNAQVSHLAAGFQPAVLRLVRQVIEAGRAAGIRVGLCGELAGEPAAIPILLGLGLDEFSMNPPAIPRAKAIIRAWDVRHAQALAARALECGTAEEVERLAAGTNAPAVFGV